MSGDDDNVIPFPQFMRLLGPDAPMPMGSVIWYRLAEHTPVRIETMHGYIKEMARRHNTIELTGDDPWCVAKTELGKVLVSTVFLGLDHRHFGNGPPLLFETMIFGRIGGRPPAALLDLGGSRSDACRRSRHGAQDQGCQMKPALGKTKKGSTA